MKFLKLFSIIAAVVFTATSCNNDAKTVQKDTIEDLENAFYSSESFNKEKGLEILHLYAEYANTYPDDSLSAGFLYKAAEISMNLQLPQQSIDYYNQVISQYPEFNKKPECLFLTAFVYENQLQNIEKAGELYSLFIAEYPNHPLAKDAQASIRFLGKSPEELVKIFQEMNEK
ncbi:MAG: tetratricopeptide repeat protein [Salinivirgaceae bacterium]|jgi:TolA-binding protein|nr:tetratricopeptide repeat protein [Salinivirgaceae bacterium]